MVARPSIPQRRNAFPTVTALCFASHLRVAVALAEAQADRREAKDGHCGFMIFQPKIQV